MAKGHVILTRKKPYRTHPRTISFDGVRIDHDPVLANMTKGFLGALGYEGNVFVGIVKLKNLAGKMVRGYTVMGPRNRKEKWDVILVDPWTIRQWGRTAYVLAHEAVHVVVRNRGNNRGHGKEFNRVAGKLGM